MANWFGYFCVEREVPNLSSENWATLIGLYESMGTAGNPFPAYNNHWRTRLDGNAVIYESNFDSSEVSIQQFKQLLADAFGINVEDIDNTVDVVSYGDYSTTVWEFIYPLGGLVRFTVRRFGQGAPWEESNNEALGYIADNIALWE